MNFDEMLEAWRAQDEKPPYRVNPDLLRVVVQQEHIAVWRELRWSLWAVPCMRWVAAAVMLAMAFAFFFVTVSSGVFVPSMWDYAAGVIAVGALLASIGAHWVSRQRQAAHERAFGNSLQGQIRRDLSRIDHQLSQYGRWAPSLLRSAPIWAAALLFFWGIARISDRPFGWQAGIVVAQIVAFLFPMLWTGHYVKTQLLAYKRRLSQLLELLAVSESFPSRSA
jgi:hypothetical protein